MILIAFGYGLLFLSGSILGWVTVRMLFGSLSAPSRWLLLYRGTAGQSHERILSASSKAISEELVRRKWLVRTRANTATLLVRAGRAAESSDEYVGTSLALGIAGGLGGMVLTWGLFRQPSVVGAAIAAFVAYYAHASSLRSKADRRRSAIVRRLPFVIDASVLGIEAGASFDETLGIFVRNDPNHPLAEELAQTLRDQQLGVSRRESIEALAKRVDTEDMRSLAVALTTGDELGTPIAHTLRLQSETMRLRRTQRAEKLAGEAGPKMALPNTIIMLANVLLILAPFLHKFQGGGFMGSGR